MAKCATFTLQSQLSSGFYIIHVRTSLRNVLKVKNIIINPSTIIIYRPDRPDCVLTTTDKDILRGCQLTIYFLSLAQLQYIVFTQNYFFLCF